VEKDEREDAFFGCDNGGNKYKALILLVCLVLYVGCFSIIGWLYATWPQECAFNSAAITTTLLFNLINTGISVSGVAEHGSLLCSGLVFAYTCYLCYAAVSSLPEPECNPHLRKDADDDVSMLGVSIVFAAISVGYIAYRMGAREIGQNVMSGGPSTAPAVSLGGETQLVGGVELGGRPAPKSAANDEVTVRVDGDNSHAEGEESVESRSYLTYHLKMCLISVYMAMLLTDWGVPASLQGDQRYSVGYASAWLQLSTNWVACLLYLWTLIAVKACPDRDFS